MRLLIVANDLVVYATAIAQPTGIQRVGTGLAGGLLKIAAESGGSIEVALITVRAGGAREITPAAAGIGSTRRGSARLARPLIKMLDRAPRPLQELVRTLARRVLSRRAGGEGRAIEVQPGDWMVVIGAPWIAPGMAEASVALKQKRGARLALLVHDLLPLTAPRWYADRQGSEARNDVAALVGAADQLFAVSPQVANDIVVHLQRNAVSLRPADPALSIARAGGTSDPYMLFVGTLHPRKRVDSIVRAMVAIASSDGVATSPRLVIAGRRHPQDAELFLALQEAERIPGLRERITLMHDVNDERLAQLYADCRFTILPSLAEGWGIPVRESLTAGQPVIASDAVPAAAGSPFVQVVAAGDDEALADAIRRWWNSDEPERLAVRIKAEHRSRDWSQVAKELLDGLESQAT